MADEIEMLELAESAQILGVHASTLRRWADAGRIQHIRTLSGRRRFLRADLERARQEMLQPEGHKGPLSTARQFEDRTLVIARQRSNELSSDPSGRQANWFTHLNPEHRMLFRYSGRRLLGLMMQFISRSDSAENFLEEGRRVAGDYGEICYRAGLSSAQTAEAFLYFRRSILESVQVTTGLGGVHDEDGNRIVLRTIDFFDALLVATIENYTSMAQPG